MHRKQPNTCITTTCVPHGGCHVRKIRFPLALGNVHVEYLVPKGADPRKRYRSLTESVLLYCRSEGFSRPLPHILGP
eukprot:4740464-Pyramimonas_sp.AAC.1